MSHIELLKFKRSKMRYMKLILNKNKILGVCMLISANLCAQDYSYQWGKAVDGSYLTGVSKVVETENSDLIFVAGFQQTVDADISEGILEYTVTVGTSNPFITRISAEGEFIWALHISGQAVVNALLLDDEENIYIAGSFEGTVDFDSGAEIAEATSLGGPDCYVAKYTSSGEFLWVKNFGAIEIQTVEALSMDIDGNLILTGNFENTVDFDPNGGIAELTPLVNPGSEDIFVVKWTEEGVFVWVKQLGGIGLQSNYGMTLDQQQNIVITGCFTDVMDCDPDISEFLLTPIGTNFTVFLVKLDPDGEFIWAHQIGEGSQDIGIGIKTDKFDNIYYTGHFDGTVDFDAGVGITELITYGSRDVFISKLAPDGTFLWVSRLGGTETEHPTDIDIDADGNIYTTGFFQTTCDFDPSDDLQNITSYGDFDGFISVLNTDGEYLWAARLGNNFYDAGISITVTDEYVYQLGVFAYGCYLDPENPDIISVEGGIYSHGYIAKYTHPELNVSLDESYYPDTEVYPNPAEDLIFINGLSSPATINLIDITGKIVLTMDAKSNAQMDLQALNSGIYVLQIFINGLMETEKIVIK